MYYHCYRMTESQWHGFVNANHPRMAQDGYHHWGKRVNGEMYANFDICNLVVSADGHSFSVYTNVEL